ncbi:nitroreductase family protein [Nocardioides sp. CBS4Y-1]|uniref:Nitroreductase family protein n=1 Tax=Nocardioides acrostichi TaxID=2784339 RepID=A0A930V2E6_9ACTN|nr:nitroreductase family protein [Nocardioides acrostichi]
MRRSLARRAVRVFGDQPVQREVVTSIVDAARWTGSARNRQPWRFVAVYDPQVKAALARLGQYAAHLAAAPVVLVVLSPAETMLDTEFDVGRVVQSITTLAAASGLGSCPVSLYPEASSRAAADLVGGEPDWTARHAVALGHPGEPPRGVSALPAGRLATTQLLRFR